MVKFQKKNHTFLIFQNSIHWLCRELSLVSQSEILVASMFSGFEFSSRLMAVIRKYTAMLIRIIRIILAMNFLNHFREN